MNPYCCRTQERPGSSGQTTLVAATSQSIRFARTYARRVVESVFGICASKWRILDKAIETKVDTGVDIVKCISLLRNIIIDFEDYCCLHSRWSQHDSLLLPHTGATRKQRTNNLGRCYQSERPFCTLARCKLRRRTATFTYMCLSAQVSRRETRVQAGRWHAGRSLMRGTKVRCYGLPHCRLRSTGIYRIT
jgi:hypothetical protein